MGVYLLSARGIISSVSDDPLYELEEIIAESCAAKILVPKARSLRQWSRGRGGIAAKLADRYLQWSGGFYQPLQRLHLPNETNVLLLIALHPTRLQVLSSLPNWRQQFDVVAAYVFDSWLFEDYPAAVRQFDHLFVPMPEMVEPLQRYLNIPVSLLSFGADAWQHGSGNPHRCIDLISYGRIPKLHHQVLSATYHHPQSSRLYLRSVPRQTEHFPVAPYAQRADLESTRQLYQLLRRSRLALAYDTLYPGMREFPHSFVTLRWFQCGAAGCAIVGKRPTTPIADELLDWEDATLELPDDPQACVDVIEALLNDTQRLHQIHRRNYLENLMRHDWRWRIKTMLSRLDLPIPEALTQQCKAIDQRYRELIKNHLVYCR